MIRHRGREHKLDELRPPDMDTTIPRCPVCRDTGHVCENHPDRAWGGMCCDTGAEGAGGVCAHGSCACGGAGQPCGYCCSPIPEDGTTSIVVAFTPDWQRRRRD